MEKISEIPLIQTAKKPLFWFILGILSFAAFLIWLNNFEINFALVLRLILFSVGYYIFIKICSPCLTIYDETKRWHATEHKAIKLIENGLQPTKDNLKSVSSFTWHCGSMTYAIFAWLVLGCALFHFLLLLKVFIIYLALSPIFIVLYELSTVKKPTDAMLNEAIQVAEKYYKKKSTERVWLGLGIQMFKIKDAAGAEGEI